MNIVTPSLLFTVGDLGLQVLQPHQVAIPGAGRGPGHQVLVLAAVEDVARVPLPEPPPPQRHAHTELHGRAVGAAALCHAVPLRLARRVQRLVLEGHREQRGGEQGAH